MVLGLLLLMLLLMLFRREQRFIEPAGLTELTGLADVLIRGHAAAKRRVDETRVLTRRQRLRPPTFARREDDLVAVLIQGIEWTYQFFPPETPFRKNTRESCVTSIPVLLPLLT